MWKAIGAMTLPYLGGCLNGLLIKPETDPWYKVLKKPSWRPPTEAFVVTWSSLYVGMGYASHVVWRDGGGINGSARFPLTLYASQLALNWGWSSVFFYFHSLKWSMVDIVCLWCNVAACLYKFWKINQIAGILMTPYLGWLTLAVALNYCIWRDNEVVQERKKLSE